MHRGAADVTRAPRRAAAGFLVAVAFSLGGLAAGDLAAGAGRPTAGPCTTATGVTVIVDFGAEAGGVRTGCATRPVSNGFAALVEAGFSIRNVATQPGFLCQIDGEPAGETCTHVPSAARYWSYWHATRGGDWVYSRAGASRTPPPGSVEGWAFGAGHPPAVPPPARLPNPTTTTRAPSPPTTVPALPSSASASAGAATSSSTPPPGDEATASGVEGEGAPTSSPAGGQAGAAGLEGDGEQAAEAIAATGGSREEGGSGSPAGTMVGVAIALALAAAGAVAVRRRRPTDEAGS